MSNLEDQAAGLVRFYGLQKGLVTDNVDPDGNHRVKIRIPGIAEPSTDWAWPLTSGGGSPQRGGHVVPAIGAAAVCWFEQGDPQGECFYTCGWWGELEETGQEVPEDVKADKANAHLIHSFQIGTFSLTYDEREGKRKIIAAESLSGDHILWDLQKQALQIRMSLGIILQSLGFIHVDAPQIDLNKRLVLPIPKPI